MTFDVWIPVIRGILALLWCDGGGFLAAFFFYSVLLTSTFFVIAPLLCR